MEPFEIPIEELELRIEREKDFMEFRAAKSVASHLKKAEGNNRPFIEKQKVLVRRPPSKKFSKKLNNWVAVASIKRVFENFYEVELLGEKKEIKGLNLSRIHHR